MVSRIDFKPVGRQIESQCEPNTLCLNPQPLYHPTDGGTTLLSVYWLLDNCSEFLLFKEATDYRSNFARTILFENCYLFFENTFQYLGGISQNILVSHFDSRRLLSSAIRQRSTSPILFVSFTQPCDQHDRKIRTIRKSAARWRGRRARGYRKLILRVNLLYVPTIKM